MEMPAYRYAQIQPDQLEKIRRMEKDLQQLSHREIILIAYEKDKGTRP